MITRLREIPISLWILQIILFFIPLFVYSYLEFYTNFSYFLTNAVWFLYLFPTIIFSYYFFVRGAVLSCLILSIIHISFKSVFHQHPTTDSFISTFIQIFLIFLFAYTIGLLTKKTKANQIELEHKNIQLTELAFFDPLTNLPNRRYFYYHLEKTIFSSTKEENDNAVLFIDLDGFKQINDTFGHDTGDELLEEVASRLNKCIRRHDILARLGGDEFTLLLPNVTLEETKSIAERILDQLRLPFIVKQHSVIITPSIGIAFSEQTTLTPENLIHYADMAMYTAKQSGKNKYHIYK